MPPRKRSNSSTSSSSKKSNNQNQTVQHSKHGIQHFFVRHSQQKVISASQNHRSDSGDSQSLTPQDAPDDELKPNSGFLVGGSLAISGAVQVAPDNQSNSASLVSDHVKTITSETHSKNYRQDKSLHYVMGEGSDGDESPLEVSPEISKSMPRKLFKFSPGMLIKQSQDDGGEEVTWKISPVNERLQAVSKKMPEIIKVLAESSKLRSTYIRQCSQTMAGPTGKIETWLSSPTRNAAEQSLIHMNKMGVKRVNPFQDPNSKGRPTEELLQLLDQVEDAISTEDAGSNGMGIFLSKDEDNKCSNIPRKNCPTTQPTVDELKDVNCSLLDRIFLVLEVVEKRGAGSLNANCPYKDLWLLNEKTGEEKVVCLWDEWFYSKVSPGDTVNVIGQFDDTGKCNVNRDHNLLIIHPDLLVSGTRVAASFSCPRRSILDERLKSNDYSTAAIVGTMLHQIFQAGLVKENPTVEFLEEYANIVLRKNFETIYACGASEKDILNTLIQAIPKLLNWISQFRDSQCSRSSCVDFGCDDGTKNMKISEVIDIEEMSWAPNYGLKGMIDASIRVYVESEATGITEKIMPLEFKSGKGPNSQSSMEHTAQVILYTLLMSERYMKPIDCGILYYLQSDYTQGIDARRSDLVGLIMRRNELANDVLKALKAQQLPPMMQSLNICKGCRHLNTCAVFHKAHGGNMATSGLGHLFNKCTDHLTDAHYVFLRHWERLIDLEASDAEWGRKAIWRSRNMRQNYRTSSLSPIILHTTTEACEQFKDGCFYYRFVRQDFSFDKAEAESEDFPSAVYSSSNDLACTLRRGDFVILMTEPDCQPIASGVIIEISRLHVLVSFSKRLRLPRRNTSSDTSNLIQEVWRIEKDEIMTPFAVMRFNLIQLFLENERSTHLRKMIVDLEAPRFDSGCLSSQDPAISYVWSEKKLNDDQRRAILKILTAKDYALILGMPGTGKTTTMVHAAKALLKRDASILLTSYTNSAIDNLLIKLKYQGIDFLRIGRQEAVHEEIREHCFSVNDVESVSSIKQRLDEVKIVAVTCLGITNPLLTNKRFDICIMDEAGQTTLPVALGPLMLASKFVLVGDHYQLPPLVKSIEAQDNGLGVSLFSRLSEAHPQAISALQNQYRMCQGIMELANALIYGDRLQCGSLDVANAKLEFSQLKPCKSWLTKVLDPTRPVMFLNTDLLPALEKKDHKTVNNPMEASIISEIAEKLLNNGLLEEDIGIITPYNSQTNLIQASVNTCVEIHTIDKYQGRDKDCILVSFVRSSKKINSCNSSILEDWHRINVALTRAKKKLIMVGSCRTLSKLPFLKLLIEKVDEQSGLLSLSRDDLGITSTSTCS
ncbi:hypothetical protein SAY86_022378 [Trapa natans]|uniref:DNA helicase n=1 Tax=Trapa natans TaxID=22666 RepID=A0AAN7RAL1_TRANT|nr:hypothetical protein SAY86_022378 [Trapa natans]